MHREGGEQEDPPISLSIKQRSGVTQAESGVQ